MGRSRWQTGHLFEQSGRWKLRYREDYIDSATGKRGRRLATPLDLGPAAGPGKMTRSQARAAASRAMQDVNAEGRQPQSNATLQEYVDQRFKPRHYPELTPRGRIHYDYILSNHVLPALGAHALNAIKPNHVSDLLLAKAADFSRQTCTHIRNVIRTIFEHAAVSGAWDGRNPAQSVRAPRSARAPRKVTGYSPHEVQRILSLLESPLREMVTLAVTTSMGAAELAGLRVGRLNLSSEVRIIDAQPVPAWSLVVAENRVDNKYGATKTAYRIRTLPIPALLRDQLSRMIAGRRPEDPVFSLRTRYGRPCPVDHHNVSNRTFKRVGEALGIPVNWHRFRHTHATWTAEMLLTPEDRATLMGHSDIRMTEHYTHPEERLRSVAEALSGRLLGGASTRTQ